MIKEDENKTGISLPRGTDTLRCPECDVKLTAEALIGAEDAPLCEKCATKPLAKLHLPCCKTCFPKEDGCGKMHCPAPRMVNPECEVCRGEGWYRSEPLLNSVWCWSCESECLSCVTKRLFSKSEEQQELEEYNRILKYAWTVLQQGTLTDDQNTKERLRARWLGLPAWAQEKVLAGEIS